MTGLTTRALDRLDGKVARRGPTWRATAAMLLAAAALSIAIGVVSASGAAAVVQCPPGTSLFINVCISTGRPFPTATTVPTTVPATPPTTAAPLISLPPPTLPPVTLPPILDPPSPVSVPDAARRLLDLANGERERAGLGALTSRDDLVAIALSHSQEMAQAGDIFHSTSFFASAIKNLLNAAVRGENVAYNGDIDNTHARLMASPGHRANLLDPRFSVVGFAVVKAPDGRYFTTQDFIQPAGAPRVAAAPKPAAAPRAPAAPRPAPAPKPAPTTTTTAAPAPAPVTVAPAVLAIAPAPPVVQLHSSAISATADHDSGEVPLPIGALAVVLLAGALVAWHMAPRRLRRLGSRLPGDGGGFR